MAITRPVTKTIISTTDWGIPLTDQVNANITAIAALQPTPWTAVTFQNGWANFGGAYIGVGYRKIGDVVYVRGLMANGTLGSIAFTLPAGFRPLGSLQFIVPSVGTVTSTLDLTSSGALSVITGHVGTIGANFSFSTS